MMTPNQVNRLPNTQEDTLQFILSHLNGSCDSQIVWLQGAPKSGKPMIAKLIASRLHGAYKLAASLAFYQSRWELSSFDLEHLVNRIANQISELSSHFTTAMGQYIKSHFLRGPEPIFEYISHMLIEPLASVPVQFKKSWVIVLDESEMPSEASKLAQVLPLLAKIPIRFLISGRLHPEIVGTMADLASSRSIISVNLDDLPAHSVKRDLEVVIRAHLACLRYRRAEDGWPPTDPQIQALIALGQNSCSKILTLLQRLMDIHSAGIAYHRYLALILQDISISWYIFARIS